MPSTFRRWYNAKNQVCLISCLSLSASSGKYLFRCFSSAIIFILSAMAYAPSLLISRGLDMHQKSCAFSFQRLYCCKSQSLTPQKKMKAETSLSAERLCEKDEELYLLSGA